MKKLFTIAALTLATATAMASNLTGTVKYDYDKLSGAGVWGSSHVVLGSLKYDFGNYGSVDAGIGAGRLYSGSLAVDGNGFELGYSRGMNVGPVALTGRVSFRNTEIPLGQTRLNGDTWRFAVEGSMPVTNGVRGFVGYDHGRTRTELNGTTTKTLDNRLSLGVDVDVTKTVSTRVGFTRTDLTGTSANYNGLTAAVSYKF